MRVGWAGATRCGFRCFYCCVDRDQMSTLRRDPGDSIRGWNILTNQFGSMLIDVSGMEPTTIPEEISSLTRMGHHLIISTNLSEPPETLFSYGIITDRLYIVASFHPTHWGYDPIPFLRRLEDYRRKGYHVCAVSIIGHPAFLPHIPLWRDDIASSGFDVIIHEFIGKYELGEYPASYTPSDMRIIYPSSDVKQDGRGLPEEDGDFGFCSAGYKYLWIHYGGEIWCCSHGIKINDDERIQNLFTLDGPIVLNDGPRPCEIMRICNCNPMMSYWVTTPNGNPQFQRYQSSPIRMN